MADYLASLVDELARSASSTEAEFNVTLAADPMKVPPDCAVSVGVIVTELVSNACKYAYPEGSGGEVRVILKRQDDGGFELSVADDGVGIASTDEPQGTGLGTKLIRAMARSLQAEVAYQSGPSGGVDARMRVAPR